MQQKYQNEDDYLYSQNKEEFIKKCIDKGMKRDTARRRFYKIRKILIEKGKIFVKEKKEVNNEIRPISKKNVEEAIFKIEDDSGLIVIPDTMKLIQLTDMRRYKRKITEVILEKNGFSKSDIAWVKYMGMVV